MFEEEKVGASTATTTHEGCALDSSNPSRGEPSEPCLHDLNNDLLASILEFTDYDTFNRFTKSLSQTWRKRCQSLLSESQLMERIFLRHGFSSEDTTTTRIETDCALRRKLNQSLCPTQNKAKRLNVPMPLRQCCFGFAPVLPDDWDLAYDNDPPSVSFDCDSFWLSSSGTSGELLFLNPFSTRLTVWGSVLQHIITPDFSKEINAENFLQWEPCPVKQVLFDTTDYFDVDIRKYFPRQQNNRRMQFLQTEDEQEFEIAYIGIEAKPVLRRDGPRIFTEGTMAAVGRILDFENVSNVLQPASSRNNNNDNSGVWHSVTELIAWFRKNDDQDFRDQHVCRVRGGFRTMDICATNRCVYVNPWSTDTGWTLDRDVVQPVAGQEQVLVYPMIANRSPDHDEVEALKFFADPLAVLHCGEPVTAVHVSGTGESVLVATIQGDVQIWNVADCANPYLVHKVSCFDTFGTKKRRKGAETNDESARMRLENHPSAVEEIHVSRHLSIDQTGFVTLQHSPRHGSTLLLWKFSNNAWQALARIDLPLSASRFPKVYFDGRKIVVLGQDHIGFLLLVYQVFYCNEDLANFASTTSDATAVGVATSGGVFNFGPTPSVCFSRRIRHAALGGLESYESLHMTCNERFIVVATKTGNFFESQMFTEDDGDNVMPTLNQGLLVIDLLQQQGQIKG